MMTFDTVSNNNAGGVSVKVEFYGELRRFSTLGASFSSLVQELIAVLDIERGSELLVTYRDEEGDLITMYGFRVEICLGEWRCPPSLCGLQGASSGGPIASSYPTSTVG